MTKYVPTLNPGDERTRARYLGITTPLDTRLPDSEDPAPCPSINVLEQTVIRKKDGSEAILENLMGFNVTIDADNMASEYPEVNPITDEPTGRMLSVAETFMAVYSFIRHRQTLNESPALPPE